jgi:hypothetical protein
LGYRIEKSGALCGAPDFLPWAAGKTARSSIARSFA